MNARLFRYASVGAMLALSLGSALPTVAAPHAPMVATTVKVTPSAMNNWLFYNDTNDTVDNTLGTFVNGPGTPAGGYGSAQISVSGTQRRDLATYQFGGTQLSTITDLKFRIYHPSAGNGGSANTSSFLFFNVNFNGYDSWQSRLIFLPIDNGPIVQDAWTEYNTLGSAQWRYSGANWPMALGGSSGTTPKTWSAILAAFPNARILTTDGLLGVRVGNPDALGYTENIDTVTFGTAASTTIFDFEPDPTIVKVRAGAMGSWYFFNDTTNAVDPALGSFVTGPATPFYGSGSAKISVNSTQKTALANSQFGGTKLSDITALRFRIYNPSAGNGYGPSATAYMYFNIDFNGSNTWQNSLVYGPWDNGGVTPDSWKEFDTINGGAAKWHYSGTVWPAGVGDPGGQPASSTKTWSAILAAYPNARILALYGGQLSMRVGSPYPGGYTENIDSVTVGTVAAGTTVFDFEPAGLTINPPTKMVAQNSSFTLDLVVNDVVDLYGYEFVVNYNPSGLSATSTFVNSFFDSTSPPNYIQPGWNADCTTTPGTCRYQTNKLAGTASNGTGTLAQINFTALQPGVWNVQYGVPARLSDHNAFTITSGLQNAVVTVYGTSTLNGVVKLQGRYNPTTSGIGVGAVDTSGTFAPTGGLYDLVTGAYSFVVPALPGGTTYRIAADHPVYLYNRTGEPGGTANVLVMPGINQTLATQTLWGGDATKDEVVDILDLTCVGAGFGLAPQVCGASGITDLNADGAVNVFDLVLVGSNYGKTSPQKWQ